MARQSSYIAYFKNGVKQVVRGSGNIFKVFKDNDIKSNEVDFYSDLSDGDFVFEAGSWVRKPDPNFRMSIEAVEKKKESHTESNDIAEEPE